ncbi:hypothetical protein CDV31_014879 [Fusarium ambrosium]|uniref:Uncharacterized protein n=1 Tax=Fusarium ambrosium TaxID=131363 RepID=A0A428STC2_9HYPO|nr:hypothetical protein CDV31_014879 [Fusarium ambrosium]
MTRSIILTPFFLPQDSIKLGRFVTRIDHPHQNHHDPPSTGQPRVLISLLDSYTGDHETASRSAFTASRTSLLSAGFSKHAIKTYTLDNSDSWFDEAISLAATRGWIERALDRGEDIYMIVGYRTVTDASVSQASILGSSAPRAKPRCQLPYPFEEGYAYSILTNGLARVLLCVPYNDPATLYYHLCEPIREINGDNEPSIQKQPRSSVSRAI